VKISTFEGENATNIQAGGGPTESVKSYITWEVKSQKMAVVIKRSKSD